MHMLTLVTVTKHTYRGRKHIGLTMYHCFVYLYQREMTAQGRHDELPIAVRVGIFTDFDQLLDWLYILYPYFLAQLDILDPHFRRIKT